MRPLPLDIRARIDGELPENEREWVFKKVSAYNGRGPYRVTRSILNLANAPLSGLEAELKTANHDYRGSILFAQYDRANERINDFTKPFQDESNH